MHLPLLKNSSVAGKRVLVRVGFDVPADGRGRVLDRFRIERTLPTLRWLLAKRVSLRLLAHRGQPHGRRAKSLSLRPLVVVLSRLLGRPVHFSPTLRSSAEHRSGEIILFENLRFHRGEEEASPSFARNLALLGDVFVNDDFSTSHRMHASLAILPRYLPHAAGLNLAEEVVMLERLLRRAQRPFYAIIGGAKVGDKLGAVQRLLPKVDGLLLAGASASTLLRMRGYNMGSSLVDASVAPSRLRSILLARKILLPADVRCARGPRTKKTRVFRVGDIPPAYAAYDLGPTTIALYGALLQKAKTVFWAGSLGMTEQPQFCTATKVLAQALPRRALTVVGGGDTIRALHALGLAGRFTFLSTGGGATLTFLAGGRLPGLEALQQ